MKDKTNTVSQGTKKSLYGQLSYKKKTTLWGIIFLLPWLFGVIAFFMVPLCQTFYYALFDMKVQQTGGFDYAYVGFNNFKFALTQDPNFNQAVLTALGEVVKNVPIQIFVALFVAILLNQKFKGRGFFRMIFFIPLILATGITKIELTGVNMTVEESQSVINISGIVNLVANSGIPTEIINLIVSFIDSIFEVITTAGVQMLIFLSGLQAISPTLYEVAKIEGCSGFESFCKITLPMISPMILVCVVYSIADTFTRAEVTDTIYSTMFTNAKYGLGASMSVVYFLVSLVVILVVSGIVSKGVFYYDK